MIHVDENVVMLDWIGWLSLLALLAIVAGLVFLDGCFGLAGMEFGLAGIETRHVLFGVLRSNICVLALRRSGRGGLACIRFKVRVS